MQWISLSKNNVNERLLQKKNVRRLTEREMLPTNNVLLLVGTPLSAPAMKNQKDVAAQKISVASASKTVTT